MMEISVGARVKILARDWRGHRGIAIKEGRLCGTQVLWLVRLDSGQEQHFLESELEADNA